MPFYDINRVTTTNGTTNTETTHLWARTISGQQPMGLAALYAAARFATAGGGVARIKTNAGAIATGGTGHTPAPRNGLMPAAQSVWADDASAITPGATLTTRVSVGFAQAGGPGMWIALQPSNRIQMQSGGVTPVDLEISSVAVGVSVPLELTGEFCEGME